MPIGPVTVVLRCADCGWRGTVRLESDVIDLSRIPERCPRCGSTALEVQRGGWGRPGMGLAQAIEALRKMFGR